MSDDVVILKKDELAKILVEAYIAGIETVRDMVNGVKIDPIEMMKKFEEGFVSKIRHTAN